MVACVFGDWIRCPLFICILISAGLFCCCYLFLATTCRSVSAPLDSPCPQAVINYRRVSSAKAPPFLPPRCDAGPYHYPHQQQKKPLQTWCWRNSSPAAFCQLPLSGITPLETHTEYTNSQRKSTLVMDALVSYCSLWGARDDGSIWGFTDWCHKAAWKCLHCIV